MTDTNYKTIVPIAAGILALVMILVVSSKYGLAMSPDSACYFSIAENILNGHGFAIYDLQPVAVWPPLFPLSLALGGLIGFDLTLWARLLNAVLFGLIVFFSTNWLYKRVTNDWLAIVGMLAILMSIPMVLVAKHVWSETLFILLEILFLIQLEKSFPKHTKKDVLILGILTALAVLTRYIGVTLIIFYFIWLLLLKMKFKDKIIRGLIYSFVSITPLLFWMWRNYQVTETLLGPRSASSSSFFKNLIHFSDSISIWFLPSAIHPEIRVIVIGVLMILALAWYFRKNLAEIIKTGFSQFLLVNWGFLLVYSGYLLIVSTLVAFDSITHRLTAPIYIPLIISVIVAVAQTRKFHISLKVVGNLLIMAWLIYLGRSTYIDIRSDLEVGAGSYAHDYWQNMPFPKQLSQDPPDGKLYSNYPDAIYLLANLRATISPHKHEYRSADTISGDIKAIRDRMNKGGKIYLAWFPGTGRPFLYTPQELSDYFNIETRDSISSGILYQLKALPVDADSI